MKNPYQTPNETDEVGNPIFASRGASSASVIVATIAYSNFTLWMLNSAPRDKEVGQLFLGVTPIFLVWLISLLFTPRFAFVSGIVSVISQLLVAGIMIHRFGPTALVLGLNLFIATVLALLTIQSWLGRNQWKSLGSPVCPGKSGG
jgi:hypothetical protein